MGIFAPLLATVGPGADQELFLDQKRRRMLWILGAVCFVGAAATLVAGYSDLAVGYSLFALIPLRMSALKVVATAEGVAVTTFFGKRRLRWEEISHFELKRFGLRDVAVPCLVTLEGRRVALQGLDSPLSGFGFRSPLWEPTLRRLSERLNQFRYDDRRA